MQVRPLNGEVVRDLGYLTLGSRLKRIGGPLLLQVQPVPARGAALLSAVQSPLLAALQRAGVREAVDLASTGGVRQRDRTGVLEALRRANLVKPVRRSEDQRQQPMMPTRAGWKTRASRLTTGARADAAA